MSNIINYINKYGHLTFEELKYNELDDLVFSVLSYVNFDGILENNKYQKVKLEDAGKMFFTKYNKKEISNNLQGIVGAIKVFDYIRNENRYKDLMLYNYSYKRDHDKQFSAMFIDIDETNTFISFEGTDDLVSGWKEDFQMTYTFPIPGHREAIKYLKRSIPLFTKRKYRLGGHSKGGNLAIASSMYANPLIKPKLKKIIAFDSPGFKQTELDSKYYKSIENKIKLYVPDSSLIGMMLRRTRPLNVIKSSITGPLAHNYLYWETEETKFIPSKLTNRSIEIDKVLKNWLDRYTLEEREFLVQEMFAVFDRAKIETLTDIKLSNIGKIKSFIDESRKLDAEAQVMLKTLVSFLVDYFKNDTITKLTSLTKRK